MLNDDPAEHQCKRGLRVYLLSKKKKDMGWWLVVSSKSRLTLLRIQSTRKSIHSTSESTVTRKQDFVHNFANSLKDVPVRDGQGRQDIDTDGISNFAMYDRRTSLGFMSRSEKQCSRFGYILVVSLSS